MKKILTIAVLAATCTVVQAQESWMNVLRSDVRTQVAALMEVAMEFSDEEAEVFWPLYREFELESSKLADQRIALIKDYAANFDKMDDEKSDEIVKAAQKLVSKRHDLNKKTHKNVRKVLSGPRAARFYQVQGQIQTLIDLQIQTELPLVEVPEPAPDAGSEEME